MATYVVERSFPGISITELAALERTVSAEVAKARGAGGRIHYLGSTYMPLEGRCFCRFEGSDLAQVQRLNDTAGLAYTRIVPAVELRGFTAPD